ncbi:MAG TPA: hypothetical protein ENJ64_06120, partial [Thiotrichales bacterium]|nr:hypothetical protein [Thiotrichales bacterium]
TINETKPWYRYPLLWMMLSIPFSAVIMGVIMIWLAVDTEDGLVVGDYYKQGLEINQVIERDKKAAELGVSATIRFERQSRVLQLQFDKGALPAFPPRLQIRIQHATRANSDVSVQLTRGIGDQYIGYLEAPLSEGMWYFSVADQNWKLSTRSHVRANNEIELRSDY